MDSHLKHKTAVWLTFGCSSDDAIGSYLIKFDPKAKLSEYFQSIYILSTNKIKVANISLATIGKYIEHSLRSRKYMKICILNDERQEN